MGHRQEPLDGMGAHATSVDRPGRLPFLGVPHDGGLTAVPERVYLIENALLLSPNTQTSLKAAVDYVTLEVQTAILKPI